MHAVTATVRHVRGDHDDSPRSRPTRTDGTSCETSKLYPCPSRAFVLIAWWADGGIVWLWTCEWCERILRRAGFKGHESRRWI